jgi:hypothetical protein
MKSTRLRAEVWLSIASVALALTLGEVGASLHRADPVLGWALNAGPTEYQQRLVSKDRVLQYDAHYTVGGGYRSGCRTTTS